MDQISFFSAKRVNERYQLSRSLERVLERHHYVLGPEVAAFEAEFSGWCGVAHGVGVANGSDALELAFRALDLPAGSVVVMAANAGYYGSTAMALLGLVPRYADIDPRTHTLLPESVAAAMNRDPQPAAILATHLYGKLTDMASLRALADRAAVPLIEDCAQAHGAQRDGRRAGAWGDLACFSFYPTKNLGALGDGGMVVTPSAGLAQRLRALRQYGWGQKYSVVLAGGRNSRLDELQAAVLRDKLAGLEADNAERRAIANRYHEGLQGLDLRLPDLAAPDHAMHLYVVRSGRRDQLLAYLREHGVGCDVHYPIADHQQPAAVAPHGHEPLTETEKACAEVLSLPCYPGLPLHEQQRVIAVVRDFFA